LGGGGDRGIRRWIREERGRGLERNYRGTDQKEGRTFIRKDRDWIRKRRHG
jgi:hypothetical protein